MFTENTIYSSDNFLKLIYADYLEEQGNDFLASVLRSEEPIPIFFRFDGKAWGWGSFLGNGSCEGDASGRGSTRFDSVGYGNAGACGCGEGDGIGDEWGSKTGTGDGENNGDGDGWAYGEGWGDGDGDCF